MDTISNHNLKVSMAKGLCIILMVIGHSSCPGILGRFIYLFHMPCFFFLSGFLFKKKYLNDAKTFLLKKVRGCYIPFVKWSSVFLLFHFLFFKVGFYSFDYAIKDYIVKMFKILTMTGSEQLLGGFWFLKELFYSSIICFFVIKYSHLINSKYRIPIISLSLCIIACIYSYMPFKLPIIGTKTILASSFFIAGYSYQQYERSLPSNKWFGLFCLTLTLAISLIFSGSMDVVHLEIFPYYFTAILGTLGVLNSTQFIPASWRSTIDYIGVNTLYILIFHFICFKLVSIIKIYHLGLDHRLLSNFPVISEQNDYYWIFYSAIGVSLPLIVFKSYKMFQKFVTSKQKI